MNRMQRLSRVLRRFTSVLFALNTLTLLFLPGVLFMKEASLDLGNHLLRQFGQEGLRFSAAHTGWMLKAFLLTFLAPYWIVITLSLGALIRLLHQFEAGEAFSPESIRMLRFLGWIQVVMVPVDLLILWVMARLAQALTAQAVHPWSNMATSALGNLFFGGVLLLIAFALEEGFRLKTEQELVI